MRGNDERKEWLVRGKEGKIEEEGKRGEMEKYEGKEAVGEGK